MIAGSNYRIGRFSFVLHKHQRYAEIHIKRFFHIRLDETDNVRNRFTICATESEKVEHQLRIIGPEGIEIKDKQNTYIIRIKY